MDQKLGGHGIIIRREGAAVVEARVHPHAGAAGEVQEGDGARTGLEPLGRVLCVDAALDGMALQVYVGLGHVQREAGGDAQLLAHQVHTGDELRDAVLHLDAGVHLHEIEVFSVGIQQKFHGAGVLVANGPGRPDGGLAHLLPQLRRQAPGGGLFDELLVAPLDGAVPVTQMDHMAELVCQHLKLDVAGAEHQLFKIHLVVAEARLRLRLCLGKSGRQVLGTVAAADAPAAAAGTGFEQHGVAYGLGGLQRLLGGGDGTVGAGGHRHTGGLHQVPCGGLGPGFADGVPAGADEFDAGFGTLVGKVGVFRQKAVAGVQGIAAGGLGHGQKGVLVEVALRGLGRADAHRLIGQLDMKGLRVRLRVHGYRLNAHFPAGPQHPQGDLAPVGDQYPLQHGL